MFSRTTMASSMRMPMASDRPSSDIVFSVKPNAHTATNDASTDTGRASPVMTVERHELRNRKTTATVSAAPSMSAFSTPPTESSTRTPPSCTTRRVTPAGSVDWISVDAHAHRIGHGRGAEPRGLQDVDADGLVVVVERERCAALRCSPERRPRHRGARRGRPPARHDEVFELEPACRGGPSGGWSVRSARPRAGPPARPGSATAARPPPAPR